MKRFFATLALIAFVSNVLIPVPCARACWDEQGSTLSGSSNPNFTNLKQGKETDLKGAVKGADPVFLYDGEYAYHKQDIFIPARGIPLEVKRTYKSRSNYNGAFGFGWDINYHQRIVAQTDGSAVWLDGEGRRTTFTYLDGADYISPQYIYDRLKHNVNGTWTITRKDKSTLSFNQNGCLSALTDRNGNALTFGYSAVKQPVVGIPQFSKSLMPMVIAYDYRLQNVTDAAGRTLTFAYDSNGRLFNITDFSGRVFGYECNSDGDLSRVSYPATAANPAGTNISYSYTNHNLETITDARGQAYLQNFYNSLDQVESQIYGGGQTYFSYDPAANTTEFTDSEGNTVLYTFNAQTLPIRKEEFTRGLRPGDPYSYVTTYDYNANYELINLTYPDGNSVEYVYDSLGNVLSIRRRSNQGQPDIYQNFSYEANYSFVKTAVDPNNKTTTYYYDYEEAGLGDLNGDGNTSQNKGNLVKISYPAAGSGTSEVKLQYSPTGLLTKAIDPNNSTTQYTYNTTTGYLLNSTRDPGGLNITTLFSYDTVGNVRNITDPLGRITRFSYDSHNNLLNSTAPAPFNYTTVYSYDANDNLAQVDRATGNGTNPWQTTAYGYDSLDRVINITDETGNVTRFGYDGNGNRINVTDSNGNVTRYCYDERGLLLNTSDALNQTTRYNYTTNGLLAAIVDARNNAVQYSYDGFDRLVRMEEVGGVSENYTYDKASNLVKLNNNGNRTINYTYDAMNRLTNTTYQDGVKINYTYDKGSRLLNVTDPVMRMNFTYDKADRVLRATQGNRTVIYAYDKNSNRVKLTYPDNAAINYTYDNLNRLTRIAQGNQSVVNYTYDGLSRRTMANLTNGIQAVYSYDALDQLTQIINRQTANASNIISQFNYTYDKIGNRKTMAAPTGLHNYTYDRTYQLKNADYPGGFFVQDTAFNYDAVGNRVNVTVGANVTNYTTAALTNRYTQVGNITPTYDYLGSMKSSNGWNYTYDYENRLKNAKSASVNATYTYDAFGRRVTKSINGTITRYTYDGDQVVAEYNATALQAKYVYGTGIDEVLTMTRGGQTYYYHYDGLGSVSNITNATRAKKDNYSYDVYGKPSANSTIGNRFMFTGREYDTETQLYHYRARTYSPTMGRFLQRDPIGYSAGDINLYRYNSNDPINWVDPFGEDTYRINNVFNKSKPTNSWISHSFMATTDKDPITGKEKVVKTYSWVNTNGGMWEKTNNAQNMEGAQLAIDTGVGAWEKGDESLDKFIDEAFEERKGEAGGFGYLPPNARGTCKDQANNLLNDARKRKAIKDALNR